MILVFYKLRIMKLNRRKELPLSPRRVRVQMKSNFNFMGTVLGVFVCVSYNHMYLSS